MSLNKVQLIGRLGGDVEIRHLPNGDPVANFTVATSERWKDKNTGEQREVTEWHRIVIFGRLAEICGQYLTKGSQVYLEGKNKTREWEKDGIKRYTTEVHVKDMTMLGSRVDNQGGGGGGYQQQSQSSQRPAQQSAPQNNHYDDDIPF